MYQDALHIRYQNYTQDIVHLCVLGGIAVICHFLPFEFLQTHDETLTLMEKKDDIRQFNQLRAAKILNVLSSLMDKNYMNISDTTGLMNTCMEYTDRKGADLVKC